MPDEPVALGTEEAGVTPPTGEGTPAVTEPTTEAPAAVPEVGTPETETPTATPQRPSADPGRELSWLRTQYQAALSDLQKTRAELQEYEYAALDEGERGDRVMQDKLTALQEQEQQLQEAAYAQGLWEYYTSLVPHTVIQGDNPVQWQESVMGHLTGEVARLRKENAALRKSAVPGGGAPKVPQAAGGAPSKKSMFAYDWEDIERMREAAEQGLISGDDLPGV
jgi:hypothetical protein